MASEYNFIYTVLSTMFFHYHSKQQVISVNTGNKVKIFKYNNKDNNS